VINTDVLESLDVLSSPSLSPSPNLSPSLSPDDIGGSSIDGGDGRIFSPKIFLNESTVSSLAAEPMDFTREDVVAIENDHLRQAKKILQQSSKKDERIMELMTLVNELKEDNSATKSELEKAKSELRLERR